jgi:hypothetical protein
LTERPPTALSGPNLLGVDVGFSKTSKSTGMAWRVGGIIGACRTGSDWSVRANALPAGVTFDMAAFDAPLVPTGLGVSPRGCEAVFYRGAFWNRCRPGMSHHGRGLDLRRAGTTAAEQFAAVVGCKHQLMWAAVVGHAMVEAFPNTFLGVLLPESVLDRLPLGQSKSDRLYEACVAEGVFIPLIEDLGWPVMETVARLSAERDHEIRAAYVCLLTAAVAHAGTAAVVGDAVGGWFWLPPTRLWADWARATVSLTLSDARKRGYPEVAMALGDQVASKGPARRGQA